MKKFFTCLCIALLANLSAHYRDIYPDHRPVKLHRTVTNRTWAKKLEKTLKQYGVKYQINRDTSDDLSLYLISQILPREQMPKHYIWVQLNPIDKLSETQEAIMSNAVAVWDKSWDNIAKYKDKIRHYYYMPDNYKYSDPVILPCFLPIKALDGYKKMLQASNQKQGDFTNHLPAVYVHTYLQAPQRMVEIGVASGQSTQAFVEATIPYSTLMTGVDIDPVWEKTYKRFGLSRMHFFGMDDIEFARQKKSAPMMPVYDIIFLDASHLYSETQQELSEFRSLLAPKGMWIFHDTYMSPLEGFGWENLNNGISYKGWDNERGVIRALQEEFEISFDESKYFAKTYTKFGVEWKIIHYPFCNGLTIIKQLPKH